MCDEDFGLRWRSLEALRNITGQEFGYYAAGNAAEGKLPTNKWKQWVEQNMKNANLKFDDSSVNNIISLFNGNDLSTWDELPLDGFNVNAVNDGWDVKDQTILTNVGKRSALVTKRSFLNYEFNFEYKMFDRNSDSGINGEIQNRAFSELKKPTRILLRNEGSRVAFKNLILKNL